MSWWEKEDTTIYKVVLNHEEQYSIWPANRENALGWRDAGKVGNKAECLAYIKEVWTDMRPLSLRKKMEEDAQRARTRKETVEEKPKAQTERESLVKRLSEGEHPLEAGIRPERTAEAFKKCVDRGYVHVRFTDTRGGTELGVPLDRGATDLSKADFENQTGTIHLVGHLTLDYVRVRCVADIDLKTLEGKGHLVPMEGP